MKITLTGATGFLGKPLCAMLRAEGHVLRILSRSASRAPGHFVWDPLAGPPPEESLVGADAVIHLAGEPVAQRWSPEVKQKIRDSRVIGTRRLVEAMTTLSRRPAVLVSASGIGYYGSRGDEELTEASAPGEGFLPETCVEWEAQADLARSLGMRVVKVRTGIVLGDGGALAKMLPVFRLGLGGPLAGGKMWMSWIHLEDMVRIIVWAATNEAVQGAVNGVAPNPVTNAEFTRELGKALHRPAFWPVPKLALQARFGEMASVVLASTRVLPKAALEGGFRFRQSDVGEALRGLL